MKHLLVLCGAVGATLLGAWSAFGWSQRAEASSRELADVVAFNAQMETYTARARLPGRVKAEQALWLQLGEQLSFRRRNNALLPPDTLSLDAAYTYVRLSELVKDRGDVTASLELLEEAVALCKQSKSVNCGVAEMQKIVHVVDGKERP
jgi:hypothetical protein